MKSRAAEAGRKKEGSRKKQNVGEMTFATSSRTEAASVGRSAPRRNRTIACTKSRRRLFLARARCRARIDCHPSRGHVGPTAPARLGRRQAWCRVCTPSSGSGPTADRTIRDSAVPIHSVLAPTLIGGLFSNVQPLLQGEKWRGRRSRSMRECRGLVVFAAAPCRGRRSRGDYSLSWCERAAGPIWMVLRGRAPGSRGRARRLRLAEDLAVLAWSQDQGGRTQLGVVTAPAAALHSRLEHIARPAVIRLTRRR